MNTLAHIVVIVIGIVLVVSPFIYVYSMLKSRSKNSPKYIFLKNDGEDVTVIGWIVMGGGIIGVAIIVGVGLHSMLFFVPDSWGPTNKDGMFMFKGIKITLCGIVGLGVSIWFMGFVEKVRKLKQTLNELYNEMNETDDS